MFSVIVWGIPELRNSLTDIRNLLIDTPSGNQVRLGEVAEVRIAPSPTVIQRDAVSRFMDVNVHVSGRSLAAVADDIDRRLDEVAFPFEYHAEVLGEYADRQAAQLRVLGGGIVALLGIFLLLQAAFESWRLAFMVIMTLPMALAGGVLAALLAGGDISLGSLFGFFAILAIAVHNSILLITHYQQLEQREGAAVRPELVLRGTSMWLAPILVTALTTGLVFLPIVLAGNMAGFEMLRPMAAVILGGLVMSTLLALFILPALYLRFGPRLEPDTSSMVHDEVQQQPAHS